MRLQLVFLAGSLLASGAALATLTPCRIDCEDSYKLCVANRNGSQRACMIQLEKCRKACEKKEAASAPR